MLLPFTMLKMFSWKPGGQEKYKGPTWIACLERPIFI